MGRLRKKITNNSDPIILTMTIVVISEEAARQPSLFDILESGARNPCPRRGGNNFNKHENIDPR
jgi:hypothetical protein